MAAENGNFKTAADFFGTDTDGVDKFKAIAMRALFDQKMEEELKQIRIERDVLRLENGALTKELARLKISMETNIDDRERVLAFKSKRIEELVIKAKEYEAINTSLRQTINGSTELTEAGRNTHTSIMLLERGLPLFHAVETCKEHEYKRLWEEQKLQCGVLQQELAENAALVTEMQGFKHQKDDWLAQVASLEAFVVKTTQHKDEKIHFLERKLVFEHDRLTREKETEVLAHQRDMEKQLTLQLDATTQRTIDENVRVQLELRYQSAQVERLLKQVDAITVENRKVSHDKQLVDAMNAMLSKKIKFFEQLFAKMQQNEQLKTKAQQGQRDDDESASFARPRPSPTRRKPPLPSLALGSAVGMQSAFAFTPPSPSKSPIGRDPGEEGTLLHLDMATLDLLGDQLNTAASELDSHLQKREFSRKEVQAMLQYHDASPRLQDPLKREDMGAMSRKKRNTKRSDMRSPGAYSTASYPSRAARHIRAAPLTLESFIDEHAMISPRNRSQTHRGQSLHLPVLSSSTGNSSVAQPHRPPPRTDSSALWKAPPPQRDETFEEPQDDQQRSPQNPLTARF